MSELVFELGFTYDQLYGELSARQVRALFEYLPLHRNLQLLRQANAQRAAMSDDAMADIKGEIDAAYHPTASFADGLMRLAEVRGDRVMVDTIRRREIAISALRKIGRIPAEG